MEEAEFNKLLDKFNLTVESACDLLHRRSKYYIKPDCVRTRYYRYKRLSSTVSAAFSLLFILLEKEHNGTV